MEGRWRGFQGLQTSDAFSFFFKHNKFAHVAATLLKMIAVYQSTTVTGDCYQSNLEMFWRRINYSDFFFLSTTFLFNDFMVFTLISFVGLMFLQSVALTHLIISMSDTAATVHFFPWVAGNQTKRIIKTVTAW